MKIELREARAHEFPVLERLMQLYLYDFAAIDDWAIADDGRYGNAATIESFWKDPQMTSFFVRVDGVLAGFVLVRACAHFAGEGTRDISEFFILRRHRRRGVGAEVARGDQKQKLGLVHLPPGEPEQPAEDRDVLEERDSPVVEGDRVLDESAQHERHVVQEHHVGLGFPLDERGRVRRLDVRSDA